MEPPKYMLDQAQLAMRNAHTPYSNFQVGACIKTPDGQLFNGCNVENAAYNLCICAESCAIVKMVSAGCKEIESILVVSSSSGICTPCGACRQRLNEFAPSDAVVHLVSSRGEYQQLTLGDLLPFSFNEKTLE